VSGPDGVQSGHKGVYWFGHERPYVQWILLLLVLPYTGMLVVGVTSFSREGADPRSLLWGVCVVSFDQSCLVEVNYIRSIPLGVAPVSPFIVFKERARVTFAVKR
jgi:hypothetical protein